MATLEQSLQLTDKFSEPLERINRMAQDTLKTFIALDKAMSGGYDLRMSAETSEVEDALLASNRLADAVDNDYNLIINAQDASLRDAMQEAEKLRSFMMQDMETAVAVDHSDITQATQQLNTLEIELAGTRSTMSQLASIDPLAGMTASLGQAQAVNNQLNSTNVIYSRLAAGVDVVSAKMMRLPFLSDKLKASLGANVTVWTEMYLRQSRVVQMLEKMRASMQRASTSQNKLVSTTMRFVSILGRVNAPVTKFISLVTKGGGAILRNLNNQNRFKGSIDRTTASQEKLNSISRLMNFGVAIAALQRISSMMTGLISKADTFINTMARLNMINDGMRTTAQLSDQILAAAIRSRSAYADTANFVARLGINAGDAFSNNDELIAFAETLNKAYKIGGASVEEQASSMLQLTQALAAGALRGEELNSVMEGAPLVIQAIQDELGITRAELRELASEGAISSDIIKRAMFNAADEINAKFATMPLTFADMMTQMQNTAVYAFQPLIQAFNDFINSTMGQELFASITNGIFILAQVASWAFDVIVAGIQWAQQNANMLQTAFVILGGVLAAVAVIALGIWLYAHAGAVLFIGAIALVAWALNQMGFSAIEVAGWIVGGFMWVGTVLYNVVVFAAGIIIQLGQTIYNVFAYAWNVVAAFVEFFANVWRSPVYSTQMLFYNLIKNILDYMANIADSSGSAATALGNAFVNGANIAIRAVNGLIELLNKIPGVNIGTVGELASFGANNTVGDSIRGMSEMFNPGEAPDNYWSAPKMELAAFTGYEFIGNNLKDPGASFDTGYNFVQNLGDMDFNGLGDFTNMLDKNNGLMAGVMDGFTGSPADYSDLLGAGDDGGAGDKLGKGKEIGDIGKIKSEVSITEEDIKLMRDIAERNFIIKYQQVTPQATVNLNGSGSTETDAKKLLHLMEKMIVEQSSNDLVPQT
ncbi:tape measure protein [Jeotgalibaca arthritidis]|uniref:Tape measure protein n=1 Tax=Jeotgalibaca arthritidis TaxID=1868794 RepID=A0A6G7KBJ6_9LACT|nr:tape measure protein [Jeotgalibaca arthritidis]QII82625.1 tape measure protein [Jeotgalibaca arthritidis]